MKIMKFREFAGVLTKAVLPIVLITGALALSSTLLRAGVVQNEIVQVNKPGASGGGPVAGAAVVSDKNEYVPNSPAYFMGVGFVPGETVDLVATRSDWRQLSHPEFHTGAVVADPNGEFIAKWSICGGLCAGGELVLVADGATSGRSARTTFKEMVASTTAGIASLSGLGSRAGTDSAPDSEISSHSAPFHSVLQSSAGPTVAANGRLSATSVASSYSTFFQLDGDAASSYPSTAAGHDWDQVYSDFKKTTVNLSGSSAINFFNDPVPVTVVPGVTTEDTYSGGNSKDIYDLNSWSYNSSGPQNKANLENAIAAAYIDPANDNHTYLYVGADRFDNSGSMAFGVWFLQTPVGQSDGKFYTLKPDGSVDTTSPAKHVNGDLLLVANFSSGSATITSFTWNNGLPTTGTTLNSTIGTAVVNGAALDGGSGHAPSVPWPYKSSGSGSAANSVQIGEFLETGVDLNLLFPGQTVFNFSSFIVETRASTSPSATLSDFIVGHVSTAPDVNVTKVADNASVDTGSQVGFTVTVANVGVGDLANVTLTDPLPSGAGNDIVWSIAAGGNPSGKFVLNGTTAGNQSLTLVPGTSLANNSTPIAVHIVGTASSSDIGSLVNLAMVGAANEAAAFSANNEDTATITIVRGGVSDIPDQSAVEGASKSFPMGNFTSATAGSWTVNINWGDGSSTPAFPLANTANVSIPIPAQSHTYLEEGSYTVTITLTLGGLTKVGHYQVSVSDPAVSATAAGTITRSYTGLPVGNSALASFSDPGGAEANFSDPSALNADYTSQINWGGSFGTVAGAITFSGTLGSSSGIFTVSGAVPYKNVGTYHPVITITHELTAPQVVTATVIINPVTLTVTADNKTVDEDSGPGTLTATITGFVPGESNSDLQGSPLLTTAATASSAPTTYPITVTIGSLTSANYYFVFNPGTLTVQDVAPAITMSRTGITLSQGDGFSRPGSFTDPGTAVATETWTITTNYGDGTTTGPTSVSPGNFSIGHVYTTTSTFAVTVHIADNYGASSDRTFTVTVVAADLTP